MTGRRAGQQADRQRRALAALGDARRRAPFTGASAGADLPMLAVLDALEHAANLARLGRASVDPPDPEADSRWRRIVVIVNSVASAVSTGVKAGDDTAVRRLYLAIVDYQAHSKGVP